MLTCDLKLFNDFTFMWPRVFNIKGGFVAIITDDFERKVTATVIQPLVRFS